MKTYRFISSLVIVAFILSACGAAAPAASEQLPLKVAWLTYNGYGPFFVAQGKELFQKHGVQVQGVQADTTAGEFIDLSGNAADCALVVFSDTVPVAEKNDIKVVMLIDSTNGADQL